MRNCTALLSVMAKVLYRDRSWLMYAGPWIYGQIGCPFLPGMKFPLASWLDGSGVVKQLGLKYCPPDKPDLGSHRRMGRPRTASVPAIWLPLTSVVIFRIPFVFG